MTFFSRVGMISGLMVTAACGGELSLDPQIQPIPEVPTKTVPGDSRPTPDPPGTANSSPANDASLYTVVTDLANDDAKKVCSMRVDAAKERKLGTFERDGWAELDHATGVDALFFEGGSSTSGGPITLHKGIQLAFPVPIVVDDAAGTSKMEERVYRITWTSGAGAEPPDLFQPGSSHDLHLEDASWGFYCTAKGGLMGDYWSRSDVNLTITARTPERVDGFLERKVASGTEKVTFSAPLTGHYDTSTIAVEGVCCLGKY